MNREPDYRFRLYVAGEAENSARALVNLHAICRDSLPARHTIEVVDVFKDPRRALTDRIFMTPTLVKLGPGPACTIVGTLSDTDTVLSALGLRKAAA
jgi:circadian clock protein KaiB